MGRMSKKLRYLKRKFKEGKLYDKHGRRVHKGRDVTRKALSSKR